ncbi:MAG TPA: histidine kinase [Streptosporangiaceae bacterium]|nr:histidine kinase [Streptosporangiaceae bacterium]
MTVRGISLRPAAVLRRDGSPSPSRPPAPAGTAVPPAPAARPRSLSAGYHRARQFALTHALVTDAVLALLLAGVCTPWLVTTDPSPLAWLLQAGLLTPLAWRRRYPSGVFAVVCTVALVQWFVGIRLVADLALLVALSTLATYRPRRVALAAAGVLEVGAVLASVAWSLAGSWLSSLVFLSGMVAAALLLGISVRARSALVATLTERAGRLERERDQQAQIAAAAERTRIAREMHDVIGHQLAVIVSLADGAAAKLASDPPRAAAAISSVADVGRQALGETRGLLGVLRADGSGDGLAPQPGLAGLGDLVAQTRATGLAATLDCAGDTAGLAPDIQLAVYRIAQEAITNTLRHASGAEAVAVRVTIGAASVVLEVTDDGRPAPAAVPGRAAAPPPGPGGGQGLTGMRERARAYGGSVTAGPGLRGWEVRATFPMARRR